jgi:polyisoprenoid-binding protein YceI
MTSETAAVTASEGVTVYELDPTHSSARFSVRHMMISHVRGEFSQLSGSLNFNRTNPVASSVTVEIDASSISTGQADRDTHLKSGDFLALDQYPVIKFVSKSAAKIDDERGTLVGDLTMHGVTREVSLDVEGSAQEVKDPWGNFRLGFSARTKIKRSDFGLTYNAALEAGGVLIGDDVEITIDAQFVRQA